MSNSLGPPWTVALSVLCPWDSPGKNTGVGCHFLLQESSQPRDQTRVSHIIGIFFTEPPGVGGCHLEGEGGEGLILDPRKEQPFCSWVPRLKRVDPRLCEQRGEIM